MIHTYPCQVSLQIIQNTPQTNGGSNQLAYPVFIKLADPSGDFLKFKLRDLQLLIGLCGPHASLLLFIIIKNVIKIIKMIYI